MKCSVYIATSADGYIATLNGDVSWLHKAGDSKADMSNNSDMGFNNFISSVDCMIMGRKCMEAISSFNLSPEQWPYGNIKIYVLSKTLTAPPANLQHRVEIFTGEIASLIEQLEQQGFKHAYIDGGATITSFLQLKLINEMTITKAPIILGEGIPLFGNLDNPVKLVEAKAVTFPNDFVQIKYGVSYY
ncbi:dihydrofolate reductase [Catenovulum agarivorans DS-2]|uniref:Dihydrofolate reductase n=1 Tax=Catenovulum agarivorans DS-2 TaxID=1328313 RepID=W7QL20_9ALTE|nr:dihydrofolate reductase family protein [Catenovulum agarivorans]EWH08818.1 dihydrofolate reductase [Catenovulum agarivorans DS-2]